MGTLIVLSVSVLMLSINASDSPARHPSHPLSDDEHALVEFLGKPRLTPADTQWASELILGVRLVAVRFHGQADFPFELQQSIQDGGGSCTVGALMSEKDGRSVVLTRMPLISLDVRKHGDQVLPILGKVRDAGFQPYDALIIYEPDKTVADQVESLSADATQNVWQTLTDLKSTCPQLAAWDGKALTETKQRSYTVPSKSLRFSHGIETSGDKINYTETHTSDDWCRISMWSRKEDLRLQSTFDYQVDEQGKYQQHWTYPRLGWCVHWTVESGDDQFSRRVCDAIEQSLEPLKTLEESLGGTVVKNSPLRTF